jgi:hypothetical protein
MDCASCGTPLRPTDHFCRKCGKPASSGAGDLPAGGPQIGGGTWTCTACGAETPDDKRFCQTCGTPEPPAAAADVPASAETETQTVRAAAPQGPELACPHCGTLLAAGSQFCNGCGAPLLAADERLYCAACGQELPQGAAFCNVCGAAAPQLPAPPEPADPVMTGGGHRNLYIYLAAAACVIAALAVAGVVFLPGLLHKGPTPPTLTEQVTKVMGPVVQSNEEFRAAVKDIRPNGPNVISLTRQRLRVCDQKGRAVRNALQSATATLSAAPAEDAEPATAAETAAKQALLDAFKANKVFVQSIQSLPADPLRLTKGMVSQCRKAAQEAGRAYDDATARFAALQPTYQLPAVALTGNATTRLMLTAARMGKERAFIAYLGDVNSVLGSAGSGSSTASEAVAGTQDDCRIEPDEAASMMQSAISSRQSSISSVQSVIPPADERAASVQSALIDSLNLSLRGDQSYLMWIQDIADYYYRPPEGLGDRDPRSFAHYDEAEGLSASAGGAKAHVCQLLNRWNQKYNIGRQWSVDDF